MTLFAKADKVVYAGKGEIRNENGNRKHAGNPNYSCKPVHQNFFLTFFLCFRVIFLLVGFFRLIRFFRFRRELFFLLLFLFFSEQTAEKLFCGRFFCLRLRMLLLFLISRGWRCKGLIVVIGTRRRRCKIIILRKAQRWSALLRILISGGIIFKKVGEHKFIVRRIFLFRI